LRSRDEFDDDDSAPPTAGRRQRDYGGRATTTTTTTTHAAIPASRANASIEGMTMMAQAPAAAIVAPPT
jgi:hypothetical protein